MSYPYDQYNNFNSYLPETFNYTTNRPLNYLMGRPEIVEYGPHYPHPMDQQMNQVYRHGNHQHGYNGNHQHGYNGNHQHGYNRQQGLYVPERRDFNYNQRDEYPPDQVTANIRLSNSQYMNGLVSAIHSSTDWDATIEGADEITVTGHTRYSGRGGQNEILSKVKSISRDQGAYLY